MSNYCQNLKAKLDQVDSALAVFKAGVDTVTREGNLDVMESCRQNAAKAFNELEETWVASFVEFQDRGKIFGGELDALKAHAKANGFSNVLESFSDIVLDENGFTVELSLDNHKKDLYSQNLANFSRLKKLEIYFANFTDGEWIRKLPHVEEIRLDKVKANRPLIIPENSQLKMLSINDSNISKINALGKNVLETINLFRCSNIRNMEFINEFPGIQKICIDECPVKTLDPLRKLDNVQSLIISKTKISSLEPIRDKDLYRVDFSGTPVSDITPLTEGKIAQSLEDLNIANSRFTKVEQLEKFNNLRRLNIGDNLKNLDRLPVMPQLDTLAIDRDKFFTGTYTFSLKNINNKFPHLRVLSIGMVKNRDIAPLLELNQLQVVYLVGTPIEKMPEQMAIVEELRNRGVDVHI